LTPSDEQLLVYVTASLPDGTIRQIEATIFFTSPTYEPDEAIIVVSNIRSFGGSLVAPDPPAELHAPPAAPLSPGTVEFKVTPLAPEHGSVH
jgi:hypothetical protein